MGQYFQPFSVFTLPQNWGVSHSPAHTDAPLLGFPFTNSGQIKDVYLHALTDPIWRTDGYVRHAPVFDLLHSVSVAGLQLLSGSQIETNGTVSFGSDLRGEASMTSSLVNRNVSKPENMQGKNIMDQVSSKNADVSIRSLSGVCMSELLQCWCRAFADYNVPYQVSEAELRVRLKQDGYVPRLSCGAFVDNTLVGFWLTGMREEEGKLVGYDAGTALIPEYRGKGISTKLSTAIDAVLKQNNITKYIIEVFCENEPALGLYKKQGFSVVETVHTFRTEPYPEIQIEIDEIEIIPCSLDEAYQIHGQFLDFTPTWQNTWAALRDVESSTVNIIIKSAGVAIGYAVYQPVLRRIAQFGLREHPQSTSALGQILRFFKQHSPVQDKFEMVNIDPKSSVIPLLESYGIKHYISLYVMERSLNG